MGQSGLNNIVNAYIYIHSFYHTICYISTYYIYIGSKLIRKQFNLHYIHLHTLISTEGVLVELAVAVCTNL